MESTLLFGRLRGGPVAAAAPSPSPSLFPSFSDKRQPFPSSGLFEGLQAYRQADGSILLFRPAENALRMRTGAGRMCMSSPTVEQFVEVLANRRCVP